MVENKTAYCGNDCSECPAFRSSMLNNNLFKKVIAFTWSRELNTSLRFEDLECMGCKSNEVLKICKDCYIRKCCISNEVSECKNCSNYPCKKIEDYSNWIEEKKVKYLWSENPYSEILEITKTSKFKIEEVYEVLKDAVYLPTLNKIQNIIIDCFDSQNKKVYGFFQNNVLIGILIAEYKNKIEIKYLSVHEYFRKEGIGSQLIDFIKEKKKEIIFLYTDSDSVGFYRLNSFHCIERFEKNNEEYLRYYCVFENN